MPPPDLRAERLELINSALRGPLVGLIGYTPGFPPTAIALYIAAIAWEVADQIMVELDALP